MSREKLEITLQKVESKDQPTDYFLRLKRAGKLQPFSRKDLEELRNMINEELKEEPLPEVD